MLGFQGGVSIPLVTGGVKAPPVKRQCRAGPKAEARRGFTESSRASSEGNLERRGSAVGCSRRLSLRRKPIHKGNHRVRHEVLQRIGRFNHKHFDNRDNGTNESKDHTQNIGHHRCDNQLNHKTNHHSNIRCRITPSRTVLVMGCPLRISCTRS